jgi:hypothetical protein
LSKDVIERGLEDILNSERELRKIAEVQNREMRKVLTEVAYRLAGDRMEVIRKQDPGSPDNWDSDDWREFFAKNIQEISGWDHSEELRKRLRLLERERDTAMQKLEELRGHMAEKEAQVTAEKVDDKIEQEKVPDAGSSLTSNKLGIFESIELPEIPRKPPTRFASRLGTGKRWKRQAQALYLMAVRGLSLRLEILQIVGEMENVSPNAGSLRRMIDDGLISKGLVVFGKLSMNLSQPAKLVVLRLTDDGRELCNILGWEPVESEWERLIRLHDGNRQEEHTAGVLAFSYHSHRRGWQTEVLPDVEGNAKPDVLVIKGEERIFVEVEFGEDKPNKWRNLAELQGFVALCAATAEKRSKLVAECKLDKLSGIATDIETLIQESGGITGKLWVEKW